MIPSKKFMPLREIIKAMFTIRQARGSDLPAIRALIHQVQINPMSLDWRRFIVAVTSEDTLIGCGQIKPHRDGSSELASIAVIPEWRNQGVARAIIHDLMQSQSGRLYLTCRAGLGSFYEKFGFHRILEEEMPPYFRRISRLFGLLTRVSNGSDVLYVMVRDQESIESKV